MATSEWVPVVDISHWQGDYDFVKARQEGVEGFILRVCHGDELDRKVNEYYTQARAAGYDEQEIGFYQFINPKRGSARDTALIAAEKIKEVTDGRTDVLYMLDVENYLHFTPDKGEGAWGQEQFAQYLREHWTVFASVMHGCRVIAYSNRNFWNGAIGPNDQALAESLDWIVPRYPVYSFEEYESVGFPPAPDQWDEYAFQFESELPQSPVGVDEWAGWQFSAGYNQQGQRYGASSRDLDLNIVRREYWEAWKVPTTTEVRYPYGYGTGTYTMEQLRARYEPKMHPEFARRLFNWLEAQGGKVGIGGGWRPDGGQPDKPGYAPEGKSFHQYQAFPSGNAYAAVDLVVKNGNNKHRAPTTAECPQQGSAEAAKWGVHINVGTPGSSGYESWHMQPVEIDGWGSWVNAGRPDLQVNYPIPGQVVKPPIETLPDLPTPTLPPILGVDMNSLVVHDGVRLYDSRRSGDKKKDKGVVKIQPANATPEGAAVVLALTAVLADEPGFVTVWSGEGDEPNVSNVNYAPGDTSPQNGFALTPVGDDGTFSIFVRGTTHVIVDQLAYVEEEDAAVDVDVDIDIIVEAAVDAVVERLQNG